jgi:hypothetical protein
MLTQPAHVFVAASGHAHERQRVRATTVTVTRHRLGLLRCIGHTTADACRRSAVFSVAFFWKRHTEIKAELMPSDRATNLWRFRGLSLRVWTEAEDSTPCSLDSCLLSVRRTGVQWTRGGFPAPGVRGLDRRSGGAALANSAAASLNADATSRTAYECAIAASNMVNSSLSRLRRSAWCSITTSARLRTGCAVRRRRQVVDFASQNHRSSGVRQNIDEAVSRPALRFPRV